MARLRTQEGQLRNLALNRYINGLGARVLDLWQALETDLQEVFKLQDLVSERGGQTYGRFPRQPFESLKGSMAFLAGNVPDWPGNGGANGDQADQPAAATWIVVLQKTVAGPGGAYAAGATAKLDKQQATALLGAGAARMASVAEIKAYRESEQTAAEASPSRSVKYL